MIFYGKQNVYEAAKDRIRYLFDEFPDRKIVVAFSGGKDSTAILYLVKEIMDERGIKTIPVFFLDQELEAPQVVDYVRQTMHLPWVEPYWVQSYFKEWNASKGDWFNVWGPGEKWAREKEPDSFHDVEPDTISEFGKVLDAFQRKLFGDEYVCIGGLHIDESPVRRLGLLRHRCYKEITWGKNSGSQYGKGKGLVFYPIYDWNVYDVWYYIFSNRLPFCQLYNYYFTKKSLQASRVSSFIHENSIQSLREIKEIAPGFYDAALRRIENVNTTVQSYNMLRGYVGKLPPYFASWEEYVIYCAENMIEQKKNCDKMIKSYQTSREKWVGRFEGDKELMEKAERIIGCSTINCILAEDYGMTKLQNSTISLVADWKKYERKVKARAKKGIGEGSKQAGVSE